MSPINIARLRQQHVLVRAQKTVRRLVLCILAAPLLFPSGCVRPQIVRSQSAPVAPVEVLDTLLAERIGRIAQASPTFRAAWDMIQTSGIPVRVGRDEELSNVLPRWYRDHPTKWSGVTVTAGRKGNLEGAIVALRVSELEKIAAQNPLAGRDYLLQQIDRVLVHEIYGHLAPAVAARDASHECPDAARAGEALPCVAQREAEIAAELSHR